MLCRDTSTVRTGRSLSARVAINASHAPLVIVMHSPELKPFGAGAAVLISALGSHSIALEVSKSLDFYTESRIWAHA